MPPSPFFWIFRSYQKFFQHRLCTVKLCLDCFGIFSCFLRDFRGGELHTEMIRGHFSIRTFQPLAESVHLPVRLLFQINGFRRGGTIRQSGKISFLRRDTAPPRSLQVIKTFSNRDLTQPGSLMSAVETGQALVGGKHNHQGQILSVARVSDRCQAAGYSHL